MSEPLVTPPNGPYAVEIHGPFLPKFKVTIGGYRVPYVDAVLLDDGRVDVFIDERFGMPEPVSREEFDRWAHILANAMAVAAGYSCHGENCLLINKFKVRMSQIGTVPAPPNLTVIQGDKPASPPSQERV